MTAAGPEAARWAPELALAAASLTGVALAVSGRARRARWDAAAGLLAAGALLLLAVDAGLGAAEYAGLGTRVAAAHAAVTEAFRTAGLAAALAAALASAAPAGRLRRLALAGGGGIGLLASVAVPLAPVLAAAHLLGAAVRAPRPSRIAAAAAGGALLVVVASQLRLPEGNARLAALHLGLAVWSLAFALQVRGRRA